MKTDEFIAVHKEDDVRQLAFQSDKNPEVDMPFALNQIRGWQKARLKLPTLAAVDGIIYPPYLSMEQCSSEATADYKTRIADRIFSGKDSCDTLVDLTGGFGVDFSYLSRKFCKSIYVECQSTLCEAASHNFKLLGLDTAKVECRDGVDYLRSMQPVSMIYIDPARRDINGAKVYGIEDCTPNIVEIKEELLTKATYVMVKLSPMLDIHATIATLGNNNIREVHIVSVDNECKEVLLVMQNGAMSPIQIHCTNNASSFNYKYGDTSEESVSYIESEEEISGYLYEPNVSIMKMGCFSILQSRYKIAAIGRNSHLFISSADITEFPGRKFRIECITSLNKKEVKKSLGDLKKANITVRNFPLKVDELRKRLKLNDGGDAYIFATTFNDDKHILIRCVRP